jgi:hypothetical protein
VSFYNWHESSPDPKTDPFFISEVGISIRFMGYCFVGMASSTFFDEVARFESVWILEFMNYCSVPPGLGMSS